MRLTSFIVFRIMGFGGGASGFRASRLKWLGLGVGEQFIVRTASRTSRTLGGRFRSP